MTLSSTIPGQSSSASDSLSSNNSISANDRKVKSTGDNRNSTSSQGFPPPSHEADKKESGKRQQQANDRSMAPNSVQRKDSVHDNRVLKDGAAAVVGPNRDVGKDDTQLAVAKRDSNGRHSNGAGEKLHSGSASGSQLANVIRDTPTVTKKKRKQRSKSKRSPSRFKRSITSIDEFVEYETSLPAVRVVGGPINSAMIRNRRGQSHPLQLANPTHGLTIEPTKIGPATLVPDNSANNESSPRPKTSHTSSTMERISVQLATSSEPCSATRSSNSVFSRSSVTNSTAETTSQQGFKVLPATCLVLTIFVLLYRVTLYVFSR